MASSKDYLTYILEQLSALDGLSFKMMMGEYILYYHDKIIAEICDDRFLIKPVESAKRLLPNAEEVAPYSGAKPMLLVEETDDKEFLTNLILTIFDELPARKKK